MKVRITDRRVLESVQPLEVATYLRSAGWALAGRIGDAAWVWKQADETVAVPENTEFADYARRLAELLDTLSQREQRSELEILRDLTTSMSDVVRLRVMSAVAADGSVGLEEGVTIVGSAKDMILSAARAAVIPRAYFRSRLPGPADEYMKRVRLGQTEQGSYVVTLLCPVSPELGPSDLASLAEIDEPFDRRVTRTLAGAVTKCAAAAREAALRQNMEPFTSAVRDGVSANLCSAIADIGEGLEEGQIQVSFSWARSRRPPDVASRAVIPHDAIPVMREAARVLRETFADEDFELIGPVVRLESEAPATGGDVLVYAEVDTWRRIRVHLEPPAYLQAVVAHEQGVEIHCRGSLRKEGRYFTLRNVHDFGVIEDDNP
jgi:hypothetical protein